MANTTGKKFGGRETGTPNKITKELRERIKDFLNDNWEQVEKDFKSLEPGKRIALYERLLNFTLPKMQSIQTPDLNNKHVVEYRNVSLQYPNEK